MSICTNCQRTHQRPSAHAAMTREYYEVLIGPLRHVAERYGYAIAVHGSLSFDIDLVACPWREHPCDPSSLAEAIRKTAEQIIGIAEVKEGDPNPSKKPNGRLAWSFYLVPSGHYPGPYIDLSVMPIESQRRFVERVERRNSTSHRRAPEMSFVRTRDIHFRSKADRRGTKQDRRKGK